MMRLLEATTEDLPALLERLANCLPYSSAVHGVVKIRLRYKPDTGMRVLVGPASSSVVVITPMNPGMETQNLSIFWDVDQDDDRTVSELLGSTPHLDWTKPVHFRCVPIPLLQKVEQMVRSGGMGNGRMVAQPLFTNHLYTIKASRLPTTPR
ncbi:uncharacterized protein [Panulirus ornatus]|uniref:uncharacterized protein n=1 Tax=Panulirus ornatus TaxID=150431 RepID=UPI003A89301E